MSASFGGITSFGGINDICKCKLLGKEYINDKNIIKVNCGNEIKRTNILLTGFMEEEAWLSSVILLCVSIARKFSSGYSKLRAAAEWKYMWVDLFFF